MPDAVTVILPVQVQDLGTALPYARIAAATRTGRLWSGQSMGVETHEVFAALSTTGLDLQFGSAVTLMPFRHPFTAALTARSLAALSGRPYVAGIGPGARNLQRVMLGAPYADPLGAVGDYLTVMRTLLAGDPASSSSPHWPVDGLQLPPLATAGVELGLGVLREGMARLAGQVADWAITWLTPVDYLGKHLMEALHTGAEAAGRARPRVASVVHCVLDRPSRDRVAAVLASSGGHLSAPHYLAMLDRAGIPLEGLDLAGRAQALLDSGVFLTGTPGDVADQIRRYHEHGVDEVVLNLCGVYLTDGPGAAVRDLTAILEALGDA